MVFDTSISMALDGSFCNKNNHQIVLKQHKIVGIYGVICQTADFVLAILAFPSLKWWIPER